MSRRANRPPHTGEPDLDDHIVRPGSRAEILKGELLMTPGADPPHATSHCDLAYVLRAHATAGYTVAIDMLTRTAVDSDFAPDASVFPSAPDAATGKRRLEELAFEVAATQSIGVPSEKARELVRRGVRRVFCVLVQKRRVLEWSSQTDAFSPLRGDAVIEDRCLACPLPVSALLDAAEADQAVVAALLARGAPALTALADRQREAGRAEGELAGQRRTVVELCEVLGVELNAPRRAALAAMDRAALERTIAALKRTRAWPRDASAPARRPRRPRAR